MDPQLLSFSGRTVVVVVTYNGAAWIRPCLESLLSASRVPHVVVVDNASSDDTAGIVAGQFPAVELIRCSKNLGFGRGNNLGLKRALEGGARHVFLLNQDAYVLPDSLAALEDFMAAHPEFDAASPMHCSPDADHIDARTLRGYLQTFVPEYLADACVGAVKPHYRTRGVNAAAWFLRREVIERVGGFDPIFFMYGEDDDLLSRFAHHGLAFAWVPGIRVVHLRQSPPTGAPRFWRDLWRDADRQRSRLLTLIKNPGFTVGHMVTVLLSEGWVAPLATTLVRRQPREALASLLASLRVTWQFPRIVRHARLTARAGRHFL